MSTSPLLVIGVEGGASNTSTVLVDARSGAVLAARSVPEGSNAYLVGVPAVAALLAREAAALLAAAALPADAPVAALGACMSGFSEEAPQRALVARFGELLPAPAPLAASFYIDNDSPGSIYAASGARGGCCIIAGTGCMSQLIAPSGARVSCNGHGHMFGDEGSAWFVAQTAVRGVFRALDRYAEAGDDPLLELDTTRARDAMVAYFGIELPPAPAAGGGPSAAEAAAAAGAGAFSSRMYSLFYGDGFKKDFIAGFAKVLAEVGHATGDAFVRHVFRQAGRHLGSFARTLAPHLRAPEGAGAADPDVHDFTVVCVGSVWKSWELLREGFVEAATAPFHHLPGVPRAALAAMAPARRGRIASFQLVRLVRSSAVGAAWMAARRAGIDMPLDCAAAVEVLYRHRPEGGS